MGSIFNLSRAIMWHNGYSCISGVGHHIHVFAGGGHYIIKFTFIGLHCTTYNNLHHPNPPCSGGGHDFTYFMVSGIIR